MDLGLTGARAFVGGASGGLGLAVAEALAAEGARVALVARSADRLEDHARRLGNGAIAVPADLSAPDGPASAMARTLDAFGGLDLLYVNSGGPPGGRFANLTDEQWQRAIDGVLWMVVHTVRAGLTPLARSDRAAICVGLSSSVREPVASLVTSNTLRPGVVGLIKSLVPEIAPIRINGLAPGRISTARIEELDHARSVELGVSVDEVTTEQIGRIPLGRYGDPAEFGRVAAFLLSPVASYVSGAIVPVDGGLVRALP
jgi:3-oxoacyl-[acyl-carrier protein] reductase